MGRNTTKKERIGRPHDPAYKRRHSRKHKKTIRGGQKLSLGEYLGGKSNKRGGKYDFASYLPNVARSGYNRLSSGLTSFSSSLIKSPETVEASSIKNPETVEASSIKYPETVEEFVKLHGIPKWVQHATKLKEKYNIHPKTGGEYYDQKRLTKDALELTKSIQPTLDKYNSMMVEGNQLISEYLSKSGVNTINLPTEIKEYKETVQIPYEYFIKNSKLIEDTSDETKQIDVDVVYYTPTGKKETTRLTLTFGKLVSTTHSAFLRLKTFVDLVNPSQPVSGGGRNRRGKSKKRGGRW